MATPIFAGSTCSVSKKSYVTEVAKP